VGQRFASHHDEKTSERSKKYDVNLDTKFAYENENPIIIMLV
jgi:hypothetical protein